MGIEPTVPGANPGPSDLKSVEATRPQSLPPRILSEVLPLPAGERDVALEDRDHAFVVDVVGEGVFELADELPALVVAEGEDGTSEG